MSFFSGGALAQALQKNITQTAHGFAVGNAVYLNGSTWALADQDVEASSYSVGIVSAVPDANNFTVVLSGFISGLSGLTAGSVYYLSGTAGQLTTTRPIQNIVRPLLIADSATSGYVQQYSIGAVASEYGENTGITNGQVITTGSGTLTDVAGSSFTLPTAGTWEVTFNIFAGNQTEGQNFGFLIRDSANTVVSNSSTMQYASELVNTPTFGHTQTAIITTAGAATYKISMQSGGPMTVTIFNTIASTSQSSGHSRITWRKISGFLPVVGQTVDYLNAQANNATYTNGAALTVTTTSGNIPNANGVFSLSAGKTYRLTGLVEIAQTNQALQYRWRDITNNVLLGNTALVWSTDSSNSNGIQPVAEAIITPMSNITVRLENIQGSNINIIPGNSFVTIQQLGTSAAITSNPEYATMTNTSTGTNTTLQAIAITAQANQTTVPGTANRMLFNAGTLVNNASTSNFTVSNAAGTITVNAPGTVTVDVNTSVAYAGRYYIQVIKNGTLMSIGLSSATSTSDEQTAAVSTTFSVAAGDVIDFRFGGDTSSTLDTVTNNWSINYVN